MSLLISYVKLHLAEQFVIEEKAATEVIYRVFCMRKKLICQEIHLITSLAKQLTEEGIIAPIAVITYAISRHKVLEDKACKVPWRCGIAEFDESSCLFQCHLLWGRLKIVAI